jgi:hypothetical protein
MSARYFIPICLYPHTKYRTYAGVSALFQKYELRSHEYLIVVADRLLVLDRLVTGRYWSLASAVAKARREAEQIVKLVKRVSRTMQAQSGKIVYWDEIAEAAQFRPFADALRRQILEDDLLARTIEEFVNRRVARFALGSAPERERDHEREYLLSEVCMSVFCTEVLGFSNEIWERPPAPSVADPLKALYQNRPELVARVTGRPVARVLRFVYSERDKEVAPVEKGCGLSVEPLRLPGH